MDKVILALDQGTSSSRAIVFDRSGRSLASSQKEFTQYFPKPGWVEHNPMEIWSSEAAVIAEAITSIGINGKNIAAIGITNNPSDFILLLKKTKEKGLTLEDLDAGYRLMRDSGVTPSLQAFPLRRRYLCLP